MQVIWQEQTSCNLKPGHGAMAIWKLWFMYQLSLNCYRSWKDHSVQESLWGLVGRQGTAGSWILHRGSSPVTEKWKSGIWYCNIRRETRTARQIEKVSNSQEMRREGGREGGREREREGEREWEGGRGGERKCTLDLTILFQLWECGDCTREIFSSCGKLSGRREVIWRVSAAINTTEARPRSGAWVAWLSGEPL